MLTLNQLKFEIFRIKQKSPKEIYIKICLKIFGICIAILMLPIACIFHLFGFRYVNIFTERIGHLAIEPDCIIKELYLNKKKFRLIILAPKDKVANHHLLTYWSKYFTIVYSESLCFIIRYSTLLGPGKINVKYLINKPNGTQGAYSIYARWSKRPPLLKLTNSDSTYCDEILLKLGIPKFSWFVCIHARDSNFSPTDESIHRHRNTDISTYLSAINKIISHGGYVVQLGDNQTKKLPEMKGLIDYAHSNIKSERLDICIIAKSKFILGDSSGLALVGTIFGVPCALTNMTPITSLGLNSSDITIHKKCYFESRSLVTLDFLRSLGLANSRFFIDYVRKNVYLLDNTPNEILDLCSEMLLKLENIDRGDSFSEVNHQYLRPGDYAYGAKSNLGSTFVKSYSDLYKNLH